MIKNNNEITITEEESKICILDNKKFKSSRDMLWHTKKTYGLDFEQYIIKAYYNDIRPVCLKTGNPLSFKGHKFGPWFKNYSRNNFPRQPHTEETKKKIKDGCEKNSLEKFGVKNVFESEWCKTKIKNTLVEKYGVDNIMKLPEMKSMFTGFKRTPESFVKSKQTSMDKFGVEHYSETPKHRLNIRKKGFHRMFKDWIEYQNKLNANTLSRIQCLGSISDIDNDLPLKFKCNVCNLTWEEDFLLMPDCKECEKNYMNSRSKEEATLMRWLSSTDIIFETNKRFNIDGKIYESDICIEDKKMIIEFNGLFWHSEKAGKDKNYHINKLNSLEQLGYTVFQIFEDEWLFKTDIVKNKILHKLNNNPLPKIYARNCIIKHVDRDECKMFLENTHLQGYINSSYYYGAFYNNELISVMSFSAPRLSLGNREIKKNIYELVRFSTSNKYRVIGIADKLLKSFIKEYNPISIISYADKRWSNKKDNVYIKMNFKLIGETKPNYWYIRKFKRLHRFNFNKQKLVKQGYDINKTEKQIMQKLGYDRIWDCGNLKYEYTRGIK